MPSSIQPIFSKRVPRPRGQQETLQNAGACGRRSVRGAATRSFGILVCIALAWLLVVVIPAQAADWFPLSQGAPFSDVRSDFAVSPDSRWAVYAHDATADDAYELYSAKVDGSTAPVRISGLLPAGGLSKFWITPDSQSVVYVATEDSTGVFELYRVPIGGDGPRIKLSGPMASGGGVIETVQISPLGDRVAYLADQETDEIFELFSVPIDGGVATRLNPPLVAGGVVNNTFRISPLGDRVLYVADQQVQGVRELYSVPIEGGDAVKLSHPMASGVVLSDFSFSPQGDRVVYRSKSSLPDDTSELYSVASSGGASIKLNTALVSGGSVSGFVFNAAGQRVVYWADQQVDNQQELFSVPSAGGAVVKLNPALPHPGDDAFLMEVSPLGEDALFLAQQDGAFHAYTAPIEGGSATQVHAPLAAGESVADARYTSDGLWVIYSSDEGAAGDFRLRRAPASGPGGTSVVIASYDHPQSWMWELDPNSNRVIAAPSSFGVHFPRAFPIVEPLKPLGEALVGLTDFAAGGDVVAMKIAADGSLVYRADQDFDDEFALYSVPATLLFRNGFESGDTSGWSASTP